MTITFNNISTLQGAIQHLRYITGQDSLSIEDAKRLLNFALDDYTYLAMTSDGTWKFDASTHTNSSGNPTYPIATATLTAGATNIPLSTDFLAINQVLIENNNGRFDVLRPIDTKDNKDNDLRDVYNATGEPQYYDYDAHGLFVYPASDRNRIIKVKHTRAIPYFDITDTTAEIGIPRIHHEYLPLKASLKIGFRLSDSDYSKIKREIVQWEGEEGTSNIGKIRKYYSRRDEDTPNRIKPIIPGVFTGGRRGRIKNNISGRHNY